MPEVTLERLDSQLTTCQQVHRDRWEHMEDRFGSMEEKLDGIDELLRGNGAPGLRSDVEKLKDTSASTKRLFWVGVTAVVGLVASLGIQVVSHLVNTQ